MKKTILIEVILLFLLAVIISVSVQEWQFVNTISQNLNDDHLVEIATPDILESWKQDLHSYCVYGSFTAIAGLLNIVAIILIAIKDFPIFKPQEKD